MRSTQLLAERARTTAACAQEIGHKSLKRSSCLHTKLGADGVTHEASHRQAAHRQDVVHQRARLVQCPREQLAPVAASTAPPRQAAVPSTARGAVAALEQTSSVGTPVHLTVHESTGLLLHRLGDGGLVLGLGVSHFESCVFFLLSLCYILAFTPTKLLKKHSLYFVFSSLNTLYMGVFVDEHHAWRYCGWEVVDTLFCTTAVCLLWLMQRQRFLRMIL